MENTGYTAASVVYRHMFQRPYFGIAAHSAPLYLGNGNHEGELGWLTDDLPVLARNARQGTYPVPLSATSDSLTGFYQGYDHNSSTYAWEWGDALFIMLDNYRSTVLKPKDGKVSCWEWSFGETQYRWLQSVLSKSTAQFKFLFAHQISGGSDEGRGMADLYGTLWEWGGYSDTGVWEFNKYRPTWEKTLHEVLRDYGVTAYFKGHDHFFCRQEMDGVTYQLVPQPGGGYAADSAGTQYYQSCISGMIRNSGHLRVHVAKSCATCVTIEYVAGSEASQSDKYPNGQILYSYTINTSVGK
eukprot:TRINITY_DN198_c0_g1_i13.p1 TRINITY_DN198_c0_g1~~TRINITY_DN198_c0_g1_i13.p1  ORF type:complete len:299 (+),score=52.44 TRINITY_DN198_c0_g1_i13:40-936(+)